MTPGSRPRRQQLLAGAPGEQPHAAALSLVEGEPQRGAGVRAAVAPPQRGAEVDEGTGVLEPGR